MEASFGVPLAVWFALNAIAVPLTWDLIHPTYKRYGKVIFSFVVSTTLTMTIGWWSLLFIILHPLIGIGGHLWFRKTQENSTSNDERGLKST